MIKKTYDLRCTCFFDIINHPLPASGGIPKGRELFEAIKLLKNEEIVLGFSNDLCYLENENAQLYLFDMIFSQVYAQENRKLIFQNISKFLKIDPIDSFETIHNFIDFEDFIIRKGAIRAYKNERIIIPFNMRDGVLICTGKSNPEWNYSAPHGAGRTLSRSQAKKQLSLTEFKEQMQNVFSTFVDSNTLDEAPNAYKDSKTIEALIEPTVVIIDKIKPVLNMKESPNFPRLTKI